MASGRLVLPDATAQLIFWTIAVVGVALDLWTKKAVFAWLQHRDSYTVVDGFLRLVTALNDGAAFGILSGKSYLLTAVSVIALVVILLTFFLGQTHQRGIQIALALFAAGICGNLYDRLFNEGLVRDFIDVSYWPGRHWPAFNLADTFLCVGVGLVVLTGLTDRRSAQRHAQPHK